MQDSTLVNTAFTQGQQVLSVGEQLENLFALVGYASYQCNSNRLIYVDPTMVDSPLQESLVGKSELDLRAKINYMSDKGLLYSRSSSI